MPQSRTAGEVFDTCGLFRGMDQSQRGILAKLSTMQKFQSGEQIFTQGDPCPGLYVVESGLIRVFRMGHQGQQHVLHLCSPGQTFAEVAAFGDFPVPASAVAAQLSRCILIPSDLLQKELATNHELCRQLLVGMSFWVRHFVQLLDDIVLRDATSRVARYLNHLTCDPSGRLQLPATKKDIANHLNLTSETFSRVLRRLSDEEILDLSGNGSIRVMHTQRLEQYGQ